MAIAVLKFIPPGIEGEGMVEDVEKYGVPARLFLCVVGHTPHSMASGTSEAEVCTNHLEVN